MQSSYICMHRCCRASTVTQRGPPYSIQSLQPTASLCGASLSRDLTPLSPIRYAILPVGSLELHVPMPRLAPVRLRLLQSCLFQVREKASSEIDASVKDAAASGDVQKVFSVIEDRGESFSESNVTNSFEALAKFADGQSESQVAEKIHDSQSFQTLVGTLRCGRERYLALTTASCFNLAP